MSRRMSRLASSAQWRSSSTNIVGAFVLKSSTRAAKIAAGFSPCSTAAWREPPASEATSTNGPSGRGVSRPSQAPQRTRVAPRRASTKRLIRLVFPIPASPETRTSRPRPAMASARHSSRTARKGVRSSSSNAASAFMASRSDVPIALAIVHVSGRRFKPEGVV